MVLRKRGRLRCLTPRPLHNGTTYPGMPGQIVSLCGLFDFVVFIGLFDYMDGSDGPPLTMNQEYPPHDDYRRYEQQTKQPSDDPVAR